MASRAATLNMASRAATRAIAAAASCPASGCVNDRIYALIRSDGKLARFSFSRDLLYFIGRRHLAPGWRIEHLRFKTGRKLEPGETSRSGFYAICALRGAPGRTLRCCSSAEMTRGLAAEGERDIREFWLI